MKAGTAQKVVLNMLTTTIMMRLGRVYRGRMVDMRISNKKLRRRSVEMVAELAGVDEAAAQAALGAAQGHIKLAVLMAMTGLAAGEARDLLETNHGDLHQVLRSGQ
jgi:N-acetylmuramic acid 6-phosphate etherase